MNFKAVIFDMDGVLIDSEMFWDKESKIFFGKRGIDFTKEMKATVSGNSMRQSMLWAKKTYSFPESVEDLCKEMLENSEPIYTIKTGSMPGTANLLTKLKSIEARLAIASGSRLHRIETIVKRFNWAHFFEHLVSAEHVNHVGKPDPAIYTYTAKLLNVKPNDCVVLEDSVNGLRAAQSAGMKCVVVPDPRWSFGDFSSADLIANTLEDKKIFEFIGIF